MLCGPAVVDRERSVGHFHYTASFACFSSFFRSSFSFKGSMILVLGLVEVEDWVTQASASTSRNLGTDDLQ